MLDLASPSQAEKNAHPPESASRGLCNEIDGVVMLTWSDWHTEPRSNRYHYATRFARTLPVLFVQVDATYSTHRLEPTEIPNLTLLHLPDADGYGMTRRRQAEILGAGLARLGIRRPLLWIYNPYVDHLVRCCYSPLRVYHATEDYFTWERQFHLREELARTVKQCDLIVAVSQGVADSYRHNAPFSGPIHVAPNGCDYEAFADVIRQVGLPARDTRVAIFQGGINWRLDLELLQELTTLLPDWEFQLCGVAAFLSTDGVIRQRWEALQKQPNVKYLGYLSADETARAMCRATVGLIPFVRDRTIVEHSLPLKAFEYVACGLPVVSIPIRELARTPDLFAFADSAREFAERIVELRESRWQEEALRHRAEQAALRSYDRTHADVCSRMLELLRNEPANHERLNVLILLDLDALNEAAVRRDAEAFQCFSRHQVLFFPVPTVRSIRFDLGLFDAILVHGSVLGHGGASLPATFRDQVKFHPGFKAFLPSAGQDKDAEAAAWCGELRLHQMPHAPLLATGAERSVVAAWDAWLESFLPRNRSPRLLTYLAGFETPDADCATHLLGGRRDLDDMPSGAVAPPSTTWDTGEKTLLRNLRDWLRETLAPSVRLMRRLLGRAG